MKKLHPDNNRQARIDASLLNEAYQVLSKTEENFPAEKTVSWDAELAKPAAPTMKAFWDLRINFAAYR